MPLPVAAAVGAAAATTGANMFFTGNQNRKNRRFAEQQREKQYQSQLEFWRMNNAYNHPSAQMARLREGGLNPHLVYGTGSIGNSSAAPAAPQQAHWQGQAPEANNPLGSGIAMLDQFQNIEQKQAQTDNFREQNTLLKQEQELKRIGILQDLLDYDISDTTKVAVQEKVLLELDKIRRDISLTEAKTERETANISNDHMRVWNDIVRTETGVLDNEMKRKLMQVGIDRGLIQKEGDKIMNGINAIKFQLWEDGINPNDPTYIRVLVNGLQKFLGTNFTDNIKYLNPFRK